MSIPRVMSTPHASASRYYVTYRDIIKATNKLESTKEQQDTPFVESYNQQQIYIWVISHIRLPMVQSQ